MSVIIKDMEMPEDCFSCPLKEEGFCNLTNEYAVNIDKRNCDCPLEYHNTLKENRSGYPQKISVVFDDGKTIDYHR